MTSVKSSKVPKRATRIVPSVTVPVLSSTMRFTVCVVSSTCALRISMPSCEPRPVPASSAVGVARPSAHGQAITSTETAALNARGTSCDTTSHPMRVRSEITRIVGTKIAETRSARRAMGAFVSWAAATSSPIFASVVSDPTRVARTVSDPEVFRVAPVTASPTETSTGTDSPVSREASTAEDPAITVPSVAIFSPGRTRNSSPGSRSSTGICTSRVVPRLSVRSRVAVRAPKLSRVRRASEERVRVRCSTARPISRNKVTIDAESKYSGAWLPLKNMPRMPPCMG